MKKKNCVLTPKAPLKQMQLPGATLPTTKMGVSSIEEKLQFGFNFFCPKGWSVSHQLMSHFQIAKIS